MLSCVHLFAMLWTVAHQAPLSMRFSRQEDWSGQPFPLQGNLPAQGLNPLLLHCRQILDHWATGGSQLLLGYFETRRNWIYFPSLLLSNCKLCGFEPIIKSVWTFIPLSLIIVVRAHIWTAHITCLFVLCITPLRSAPSLTSFYLWAGNSHREVQSGHRAGKWLNKGLNTLQTGSRVYVLLTF